MLLQGHATAAWLWIVSRRLCLGQDESRCVQSGPCQHSRSWLHRAIFSLVALVLAGRVHTLLVPVFTVQCRRRHHIMEQRYRTAFDLIIFQRSSTLGSYPWKYWWDHHINFNTDVSSVKVNVDLYSALSRTHLQSAQVRHGFSRVLTVLSAHPAACIC